MPDCIFCKIAAGEIPSYKIYEDDKILAFLDIQPVNPGHVLIVPKKHFTDLSSAPDEIVCAVMKIAKKIGVKIIESKIGEGFNIGINTKKAAGQVVDHFHLHVMPRKEGDGRELWYGQKYSDGEAEKIVKKLIFI